jgi:hypothetical protein
MIFSAPEAVKRRAGRAKTTPGGKKHAKNALFCCVGGEKPFIYRALTVVSQQQQPKSNYG